MRTESKENLVPSQSTSENSLNNIAPDALVSKSANEFDYVTEITLTPTEKRFLLTAERGENDDDIFLKNNRNVYEDKMFKMFLK